MDSESDQHRQIRAMVEFYLKIDTRGMTMVDLVSKFRIVQYGLALEAKRYER